MAHCLPYGRCAGGRRNRRTESVRSLVRENEDEYTQLNLADPALSDAALLEAIAAHPKLLQRPVLVRDGRAIIGRTPEALDAFLK